MNNAASIAMTTEIFGLITTGVMNSEELKGFEASPHDFAQATFNYDLSSDLTVNVVSNNSKEMHLALPYYSSLENFNAEELDQQELSQASGGEIIIAAIIATTAVGAAVVTTGVAYIAVDAAKRGHQHRVATGEHFGVAEYFKGDGK